MWGERRKKRRGKKRSAAITYSQKVKTAALVLLMTAGIALYCLFQNLFALYSYPAYPSLPLSFWLSILLSIFPHFSTYPLSVFFQHYSLHSSIIIATSLLPPPSTQRP